MAVPADKPSPFKASFTGLPIIAVALLLMLLAAVTGFRTLLVSHVLPLMDKSSVSVCSIILDVASRSLLCRARAREGRCILCRLYSCPSSWQWSSCSWWSRMARNGSTDHSSAQTCRSPGEGQSLGLCLSHAWAAACFAGQVPRHTSVLIKCVGQCVHEHQDILL